MNIVGPCLFSFILAQSCRFVWANQGAYEALDKDINMLPTTMEPRSVSDKLDRAEFKRLVEEVESKPHYCRSTAFAIGLARIGWEDKGQDKPKEKRVLDVCYPTCNVDSNHGTAAVFSLVTGHRSGNGTYTLGQEALDSIQKAFDAFPDDGHANVSLFRQFVAAAGIRNRLVTAPKVELVFTTIEDPMAAPTTAAEAYLRLHLTSGRHFPPHEMNTDGVFGLLTNVAWTSVGPVLLEELDALRVSFLSTERLLQVFGADRFPYLLNYVTPAGVRIAAAHCARLGCYIGEGSVIMPAGFGNYNTRIGKGCMIEGRASAGTSIGNNSDLGGAASLMGVLSGGGTHIVTIGDNCLIGALAGTGISLGNRCTVAAGTYVTMGTMVFDLRDGSTNKNLPRKAIEFSGLDDLLFFTDSNNGRVVVKTNRKPHKPNTNLHKNA